MIIQLGDFEVESGQLVVADPCYELDTNIIIMGVLEAALSGTWVGEVEKVEIPDWGEANAKLTAYHHSAAEQGAFLEWIKCPFIAGVDSGQAGIFDIQKYTEFLTLMRHQIARIRIVLGILHAATSPTAEKKRVSWMEASYPGPALAMVHMACIRP
ncbi:hypothetical protein [Paenibacillus sp. JZ16]|uniref:hypothetical protein n=1 Tax=Paenibacillus sp. JZ16 TaxID=1906272 RepID=UPI003FA748EB